jgi:hypothetical protein
MKIIFTLIFSLFFSTKLFALSRPMGLGLMLGNPTGLSGKYWLNQKNAIDAGLGISLGHECEGNLHSDYLWHKENAFYYKEVNPLDLYYGLGGRMEFSDSIELGLRVPIGLVWKMEEKKAEFFSEIAPIFDFLGKVGIEMSLGIGARYYF